VCNISRRALASRRQVLSYEDLRLMSAQWLVEVVQPTVPAISSCITKSITMLVCCSGFERGRGLASCPIGYIPYIPYLLAREWRCRRLLIRSQMFAVTMHAP
jgi:hypothetical protein